MKIAFISVYSDSVKRGIESWVHELATRLIQEDYEVQVYQLGEKNQEIYEVKTVSLDVDWQQPDTAGTPERINGTDYWSLMVKNFTMMAINELKKFHPDIVIPLNGGWETTIIKEYCDATKAKLVLVGHWNDEKGLKQNPDLYIANSERQKKWASALFTGNIVLIENATDTDRFTPKGNIYKLALPHPRVLTVGALTPQKRIKETINAVSKVSHASLIICGDGDQKKELEELAQELLPNKFAILKLNYEDMPSLYRTCDLFTLVPEQTEAFGTVYVEAMASGLGVVAIDDETRRHIIGNAGLYIQDPINTDTYATTIQEALTKDFISIAREQALKFSWDKTAKEYSDAFEKLLA